MKKVVKTVLVLVILTAVLGCSRNSAPEVKFKMDIPASVEAGEMVLVDVSPSTDLEGDEINFSFKLTDSEGKNLSDKLKGKLKGIKTFTTFIEGDYTLHISANDGNKGLTEVVKNFSIRGNKAFYLVGDLIGNWGAGEEANLASFKGSGVYEKFVSVETPGNLSFQLATEDWAIKLTAADNVKVGEIGSLTIAEMENKAVVITDPGIYKIIFDLEASSVAVVKVEMVNLYIVGDIIGNWNAGDEANLMRITGDEIYERVIDISTPGELSLQITTADWATKYTGEKSINPGDSIKLIPAGMENSSVLIEKSGSYKIIADIKQKTILVKELN